MSKHDESYQTVAETVVSSELEQDVLKTPSKKTKEALDEAKEIEVVWTNPPTIEQLAADYRNRRDYAERLQQEADEAKASAEAKLAELVASGEALGLVLSVAMTEPELVITDWRDLRVGDEVEYLDGGAKHNIGMIGTIDLFDRNSGTDRFFRIKNGRNFGWPTRWRFIRRP